MASPDEYIVTDASLWVARLVSGDIHHQPVKVWMSAMRNRQIIFLAPSLLLAEVAGAISRRIGAQELAQQAVQHLSSFPGLRLVGMDQHLVEESARLAARLGLRGADSIYVATAYRLAIPLATLDEDQRKRAATIITVHDPSETGII